MREILKLRKLFNLLFILLWTVPAFAQEGEEGDLRADGSAEVRVENPGINVMVIDGGNPDHRHPWFRDSNGRQVTFPVSPRYINEGYQHALALDQNDFASTTIRLEDIYSHWAYRYHLAARDSKVAQLINRYTSFKISSGIALVVGLAGLWMGWDAGSLSVAGGTALGWSVGSFTTVFLGPRMAPTAPNLIYHGRNMLRWTGRKMRLLNPESESFDERPLSNIDMIPIVIRAAGDMRHPTHVSGTIAGDDSEESKRLKTDLTIHTLSFDELGLSDKAFRIGPLSGRLRSLAAQAEAAVDGSGGPRSAQSEAAVRSFLEGFFGLQKMFFQKLVQHIQDNNIRSVNMSYGADAFGIRKALASYLAGRDMFQLARAEKVAEYMARLQNDSYRFLFEQCPDTIFFIAAGNDTSPVHRSNELFTAIDGPNVFVSGAADDALRMARFSNYSDTKVDSFGLGVDRISALPDGRTGKMSGTSMASPYNMALDLLLLRLNKDLTVSERMELMKRGTVKVHGISYAAKSGGVSIDGLVIAQYLFRELKKKGLLTHTEDLAPLLAVHVPKGRRGRSSSGSSGVRPRPLREVIDPNYAAAETRAIALMDAVINRVKNPHEVQHSHSFEALEMGRSQSLATMLERIQQDMGSTPISESPSAEFRDKPDAERAEPAEPAKAMDPFDITKEIVKLLASYLSAVEAGVDITPENHHEIEKALTQLNVAQMQSQAPLIRYFVTPEDPKFRANDFPLTVERLPITWTDFKQVLTPRALRNRHVIFDISEFLIHGQKLTESEAIELIQMLISAKHRFNTILMIAQYVLEFSDIDLSINNPALGKREKISETLARANKDFPDPKIWEKCAPWS
jgi:hypothetical protein